MSIHMQAERLLPFLPDDNALIRLNAFNRPHEWPPSIDKFCRLASWADLISYKKYQIIVCTCSTAATLQRHCYKFSYVFVDEAGQALEPECLIPICMLDKVQGMLVLAGDHLQLGPVVFSSDATDNGLGISMLERLAHRDVYTKKVDSSADSGNYDQSVVRS